MGLCGVHMPLYYGEGKDNALRRLNEQIVDQKDDAIYDMYKIPVRALSPTGEDTYNQTEESETATSVGSNQTEGYAHPISGLFPSETVYSKSQNSTSSRARGQRYIFELGEDLYGVVLRYNLDQEHLKRVFAELPDLLRVFALKLSHKAQTKMHLEVSYFVRKYRQ
jgi:hypothetical protein